MWYCLQSNGLIHTSELNVMSVGKNEQYIYLCVARDMGNRLIKRTNFILYTTGKKLMYCELL